MADAEDVERALEAAELAALKARACWGEWAGPLPDEEYARRCEVEQAARRAERALRDALRILREGFLHRPMRG